MAEATAQLALPFSKFEPLEFDLYYCGANNLARDHVIRLSNGTESKNIVLWGETGTGKSHLLQAACQQAAGLERSCVYIPLTRLEDYSPDMLENLSVLDLVCIDDIQAIAGREEWERAVFNLFNQLKDSSTPLLAASLQNPVSGPIMLADLRSRLGADFVYHLEALDEDEKVAALKLRADRRGLELSDEVAAYLLKHIPRDTTSLFTWLDRLDTGSLMAQKKLTIPFVRKMLAD